MYSTITIKIPRDIRSAAKTLADELGLSLTTVVNAFLKQFIKERKFSVSADAMPSKRSLALWEKVSREIDEQDTYSTKFSTAEELFKHLKI